MSLFMPEGMRPRDLGYAGYRPSGRVDAARFGLWLVTLPSLSVALAALALWLYLGGRYHTPVVGMVAGAALGGWAGVVGWRGHCRRASLLTFCGIGAALAWIYLFFALHAVAAGAAGPLDGRSVARHTCDLLSHEHIETDHQGGTIQPTPTRRRSAGPLGRTFLRGGELLLLLGLAGGLARWPVRRAYCERCRQWMRRHRFPVAHPPGEVLVSLASDALAILDHPHPPGARLRPPFTKLVLESCAPRADGPCPVYTTLIADRGSEVDGVLLRQAVLPDAAAERVGRLVRAAGAQLEAARRDRMDAPGFQLMPASADGRARIPMRALRWGYLPVVLAGFCAVVLGIVLFVQGLASDGRIVLHSRLITAVVGLGLVAATVAGLLLMLRDARWMFDAFARPLLRRRLAGCGVPPAAWWVHWLQPELREGVLSEDARLLDAGFLWVDPAGRALCYEGARRRWRMAVSALSDWSIVREREQAARDHHGIVVGVVHHRLHLACDAAGWQADLRPRVTALRRGDRARERQAEELARALSAAGSAG